MKGCALCVAGADARATMVRDRNAGPGTRARRADGAGVAKTCWHCGTPNPPRPAGWGRWRSRPRFCCAGCLAVAARDRRRGARALLRLAQHGACGPPAPGRRETWGTSARTAGLLRARAPGRRGRGVADARRAHLRRVRVAGRVLARARTRRGRGRRELRHAARAHVVWRRPEHGLDMLDAIADGYAAHPYDPARLEERSRADAMLHAGRGDAGHDAGDNVAVPGYLSTTASRPSTSGCSDWASLVVTVPVIGYAGWPFFAGAWRDLALRRLVDGVCRSRSGSRRDLGASTCR